MAVKPVKVFKLKVVSVDSVIALKGPFNGTHRSSVRRVTAAARLITLSCYCDAPVTVTVWQRQIAHWQVAQVLSGAEFGTKIKLLGKAQDVHFVVDGEAEGLVEVTVQ